MLGILTSVIIVLILISWAASYYRRGLVSALASLGSILFGLILAADLYHPVGVAIANHSVVGQPLSNVVAYVALFAVGQAVVLVGAHILLRRFPLRLLNSTFGRVLSASLGGVEGLTMVALVLLLFSSLPIQAGTKDAVTSALFARPLLQVGQRLQSVLAVPSSDFSRAINLLTVDPESEQTIELGFTASGTIDEAAEQRMLQLVNQERISRGISALTLNRAAQKVAREHSRDMLARGYFSHITPEGASPFDRMEKGGVRFTSAGENIALAPTLNRAHVGLMNSPGHRANILSPDYHTVGIGIINAGPYGLMVTQDFTD